MSCQIECGTLVLQCVAVCVSIECGSENVVCLLTPLSLSENAVCLLKKIHSLSRTWCVCSLYIECCS